RERLPLPPWRWHVRHAALPEAGELVFRDGGARFLRWPLFGSLLRLQRVLEVCDPAIAAGRRRVRDRDDDERPRPARRAARRRGPQLRRQTHLRLVAPAHDPGRLARAQDDLARAPVQVRHGRAGRGGARAGPGSRQRAGIEWSSPRGARANRQRRAVRSRPGARWRMKRDNQCSVVICAYTEQRWDDLLAAVNSVRRQTLTPREIIVVVDHNPAMLARVRDEIGDVLAVENQQRQGLSGARNSGLRASSGEYVAFLDDDALAEPDWLGRLAAGYDDPHV